MESDGPGMSAEPAGPSGAPGAPGPGRLAGLLALARAALFWERLWSALWPLSGVLGLFLALTAYSIYRMKRASSDKKAAS